MKPGRRVAAEVVDLFCGIGALSHGLKRAGMCVMAGYDLDERCRYAFETNNKAKFIKSDIFGLQPSEIKAHFSGKVPSVLAGCAPCQPFSAYKRRYDIDMRWKLVSRFARLATAVKPDFITMENVPSLQIFQNGTVFKYFCESLLEAGYEIKFSVVNCELLGIPQSRKRLVLIASRTCEPQNSFTISNSQKTVRAAIGHLSPIVAGERNFNDPLHISPNLSTLNFRRIQCSKPGGTWRDWPIDLRTECHRRFTGFSYSSVYSRMEWDKPAPTITTQCYGFGNGRFGHPEQDRAISLREAALLQSFPTNYQFLREDESPTFKEIGRWIGNAVPVKLAEEIGKQIQHSIGV